MKIGGFLPFTTIDFPGRLAAVVFCQGCPWRCDFCHNPGLLPEAGEPAKTWDEVLRCLETRKGLLDGVVFSGGEPTLQETLSAAISDIRDMGFLAGMHTAGPHPERLDRLLPLIDWVGMDIKAPFDEYEAVTGISGSGKAARESARILVLSGVSCEFRTTLHPLLSADGGSRLLSMAHDLRNIGAEHFVIQKYLPPGGPASESESPFPSMGETIMSLSALFPWFSVRN